LPFWIEALARARAGGGDLAHLLTDRLRGVGADAGVLLANLAVAGRPIALDHLGTLTEWPALRVRDALVAVAGEKSVLTYEDAKANRCRRVAYIGGEGFVDRGFGHVHRAIAGPDGADFYVVYLLLPGTATHVIPAGAPTECSP
jgi:hypothetical protein